MRDNLRDMTPKETRALILRINRLVRAAGFDMTDLVVLMAIVPDGQPTSVATIATLTDIPRRTIKRHLARLVEAGQIVHAPGRGSMWIRSPFNVAAHDEFHRAIWEKELLPEEFGRWVETQRKVK